MNAKIARLARLGLSDPQIGAALGLSAAAVRSWRRRYGIAPGVAPGGQPPDHSWEQTIRDAWSRGLTCAEIAAETGYTVRTVRQRLHQLRLRAHRR